MWHYLLTRNIYFKNLLITYSSKWFEAQSEIFDLDLGGVRQARAVVQRMGDAWEPQ